MKRFLCCFFALALLLFTACQEETINNSSICSEDISTDLSIGMPALESSSIVSEANSSIDESLIEDSSIEVTLTKEEIIANIASINTSGFESNISINERLSALKQYLEGTDFGFFYCDLEYNGYVAYGCDRIFKTASTSKLHYVKWLCTLADNGEIDINDTMVYEARHKTSGSGIMKNMSTGGGFSVKTLMDYTLRYSDNIAYSMLIEKYGLKKYIESVKDLGLNYITTNGYANCTTSTMAALLYDTALYNGENLKLMLDAGCNASYNYQIGAELKEHTVMQKYGAMKPGNIAYHDIAVVYSSKPYIIAIYTTIDYDSAEKNIPFRRIARLTNDLHELLYHCE